MRKRSAIFFCHFCDACDKTYFCEILLHFETIFVRENVACRSRWFFVFSMVESTPSIIYCVETLPLIASNWSQMHWDIEKKSWLRFIAWQNVSNSHLSNSANKNRSKYLWLHLARRCIASLSGVITSKLFKMTRCALSIWLFVPQCCCILKTLLWNKHYVSK